MLACDLPFRMACMRVSPVVECRIKCLMYYSFIYICYRFSDSIPFLCTCVFQCQMLLLIVKCLRYSFQNKTVVLVMLLCFYVMLFYSFYESDDPFSFPKCCVC